MTSLRDEAPPRFQTAEEYAFDYLRKQILVGHLEGGARVNQDAVAAHLSISRMPVRQALLRLESEGLVLNRPNRGAVVTQLSAEAILELFEMRSVLEGLAMTLALPNIDAQAINEIERRVAALPKAKSDVSVWIQLHDELHDYICEFAHRPRLRAQLRNLRQSVVPYLRLYLSTNTDAEITGVEHQAIVAVVRRGDAASAEHMMRDHVLSAAQGVVEFVRSVNKEPTDAQE